tara:strand:- start:328 stop:873 length:546 start_codon:yes stop_codon:yes gene_type:complete
MPEKNNKDQRGSQVKVTLNKEEKLILDTLAKLQDSSKAKVFQSLLNEYGSKEISKYSNEYDFVKALDNPVTISEINQLPNLLQEIKEDKPVAFIIANDRFDKKFIQRLIDFLTGIAFSNDVEILKINGALTTMKKNDIPEDDFKWIIRKRKEVNSFVAQLDELKQILDNKNPNQKSIEGSK